MTSMYGGTWSVGRSLVRGGIVAIAASVLLGAAGCGKIVRDTPDGGQGDGGDDDGEPDAGDVADAAGPAACAAGGDPSYDDAWTCLEQAACDLYSRCVAPLDETDCYGVQFALFTLQDRVEIERVREAVDAGIIAYHPEQVASCIDYLANADCTLLLGADFDFADICAVFTGTVDNGGACVDPLECSTSGSDCVGPAKCGADDLCCVKACTAPTALGNDCTVAPCEFGGHCVSSVCRSGETGSPCTSSSDCDVEFWCEMGSLTCQPDVATTATCTQNEQCLPPDTCVGNDLPGSTGGTCARSDRVGDLCDGGCFGFFCQKPSDSEVGTCVEFGGEGADCSVIPCGSTWSCVSGVCAPRGEIGASCTVSYPDCRQAYFCDNDITMSGAGTCSASLPIGATCNSDSQCGSGICNPSNLCDAFPGCYP